MSVESGQRTSAKHAFSVRVDNDHRITAEQTLRMRGESGHRDC